VAFLALLLLNKDKNTGTGFLVLVSE